MEIIKSNAVTDAAPLSQIKVIAYKEKGEWTLESKYNIGKRKMTLETQSIFAQGLDSANLSSIRTPSII